jgi:hypothetical protein
MIFDYRTSDYDGWDAVYSGIPVPLNKKQKYYNQTQIL